MRIAAGIIFLLFGTVLLFAEKIVTERDLIDLLRNAWTSFLTLGIVSILIEWQFRDYDRRERSAITEKINTLGIEVSRKFFESAKDPATAAALLRQGLRHRIGNETLADALCTFFATQCSDQRYVLRARILFRVQAADSAQFYRLMMRQILELEKGVTSLIVAIVQNNPTIERIANYNPYVDVVLCPSDYSLEFNGRDVSKHLTVRGKVLTPEGQQRVAAVSSNSPSQDLKAKIAAHSKLSADEMRSLALVEYTIPCSNVDRAEFEVETTFIMKTSDNYNVWSADRPTWVETIEFDFHELSNNMADVALHLFLFNPEVVVSRRDTNDSRVININGWLLPGQGAMIVWRWK